MAAASRHPAPSLSWGRLVESGTTLVAWREQEAAQAGVGGGQRMRRSANLLVWPASAFSSSRQQRLFQMETPQLAPR
ncbi:hypothetical protein P7K49_035896 [Saguinus oedipus]|uniref:Uncharacterized protein n=1 Tax=Saguinus oedipus TaxID=9490 RepID=A0ABQ9TP01_SAGOE|nr:hypothetical protein P7K49_035896 [Saguinus oedipus]